MPQHQTTSSRHQSSIPSMVLEVGKDVFGSGGLVLMSLVGNGPYVNSTDDPTVKLHIPGKTGGGCITDGPFVDMSVNMGPGKSSSILPLMPPNRSRFQHHIQSSLLAT